MITKIEIQNFKNLENVVIELSPTINSFIGSNGSGKSSIIWKSTKLVLKNENWGFSKVLNGTNKGRILIESKYFSVDRSKTKSSGKVILNGIEYEKKTDLEKDFQALGFYDYSIGGKNHNFDFLKSRDVYDYLPKTAEGLYLKLSSVFGYSRISQARKQSKKSITELNNTLKKQNSDLKLLDELVIKHKADIKKAEDSLITIGILEGLLNDKSNIETALSKITKLVSLKQSISDLKTKKDDILTSSLINETITELNKLTELYNKKDSLNQLKWVKLVSLATESIDTLVAKQKDLLRLTIELSEQRKLIPRCKECGQLLDL